MGRGRRRGHKRPHSSPGQQSRDNEREQPAAIAGERVAPHDSENHQPHPSDGAEASGGQNPNSDKSILDREMVKWTAAIGRWTRVVGVFTALLFIATGASVYVLTVTDDTFRHQLGVIEKQLEEMKITGEANKKFAEAAIAQAQAAKDQAAAALAQAKAAQALNEDGRLTIVPSFQAQTPSGRVISPKSDRYV